MAPLCIDALLYRLRRVEVQEFIGSLEIEQGCREREESHQASPTRNGEVNDALLSLQTANQFTNGIERTACRCLINNIVNDVIIMAEDLLVESEWSDCVPRRYSGRRQIRR